MINPYKKIKELQNNRTVLVGEIDRLCGEINELKGIPSTSIHPKYKTLIEEVREIDGRMLYKFKSLLDMPHNRYNKATRFVTEFDMRIDTETIKAFNKEVDDLFDKILVSENLPQTRRIARKGMLLTDILETRIDITLSLDASYRLASCIYFWKDEDLDDYDFEIGDEKITLFKEIGFDSFFLSKPMNNFIPQMNLSAQDLNVFSRYEKELKKLQRKLLKGEEKEHSKHSKQENGKKEKTIS